MDKKRPVRPSALRAQQTFVTNGAAYQASSDDEDNEARPATRTSRRGTRVDLTKLDANSLLRYRKCFNLGPMNPAASREELLPGVLRHFAAQVVDEEEVLLKFVQAVQRHSKQVQQQQQLQKPAQMVKKITPLILPPRGPALAPTGGINKLRK